MVRDKSYVMNGLDLGSFVVGYILGVVTMPLWFGAICLLWYLVLGRPLREHG